MLDWLRSARGRYIDWHSTRRRERRLRRFGRWQRMRMWLANGHLRYQLVDEAAARARQRSNTIFLIGTGPSAARLTAAQWRRVRAADSFGINLSFLLDHVPTFQLIEDPKAPALRSAVAALLAPRRKRFADVLWVMHRKQAARCLHPRYSPDFFPENPSVWFFDEQPTLQLERDRPFEASDFERAIAYRGSMSVALALVLRWGYRRIVLLGVDLHTHRHFFDEVEEASAFMAAMREFEEAQRRRGMVVKWRNAEVFPTMVPIPRKYRPFDEYLYALNELYCRPRGIGLFVANADNILCPKLPCFEDW